jgi:hypothetical protein
MADLDALSKLPLFEWRDQQYPVIARSVSFAHENASHRLQYRNDDFIEQLGPHSLTFRYTLSMRQGIASGPYKNLFLTGYPILFAAMRDREKGVLVDPVLGVYRAVPTSWSDDLDIAKRDGTDVQIEFTHAPDEDEVEGLRTVTAAGLQSEAGALDEELTKVDWEQEPSPEPTMDALNAISGVGAQIEAQGGKVAAALEDFAYKCEKIDQQIDRLQNPDVWPLKRAVRRNRASSVALAKRGKDPTKEIVTTVVGVNKALSVLAQESGMTLRDLLLQNPMLARSPFARPGAKLNAPVRRARS